LKGKTGRSQQAAPPREKVEGDKKGSIALLKGRDRWGQDRIMEKEEKKKPTDQSIRSPKKKREKGTKRAYK